MDSLALVKWQVAAGRRELQGVMADVTQEMAHWTPPGVANPIVDLYLHAVLGQDRLIGRLQGKPPLFEQWANRLNAPANFQHTPEASRALKTDIATLKQYAEAVFASVDGCLATLKDSDLERLVEGFRGQAPMANQLSVLLITHPFEHIGEISAIKGCQGQKGYATA